MGKTHGTKETRTERVLRGGSWVEVPYALRTTIHFPTGPSYIHEYQSGVRCVRDFEEPSA